MELESLATLIGADRLAAQLAVDHAVDTSALRVHNGKYSLKAHVAEIPPHLKALFDRVEPILDETQPPSLGDIGKRLNVPLNKLERDFRALAALRLCIQISPNRFYLPPRLAEMTQTAIDLSETQGTFNVRAFRDAAGMGRNVVIEVLEYFDSKGFTRREGDERRVVGDPGTVLS